MPLEIISAKKLGQTTFEPTEYFVEKMLVPGLTVLAGKPKRGKSLLALSLALAVAKGKPLFRHLKTSKCQVLYLGLEDGLPRLQVRLKRMTKRLPLNLKLSTQLPRLDQGGLEELHKYLAKRINCRVIIIDTLAHVRPPIKKPSLMYQEDVLLCRRLKAFAEEHNAALIFIHHSAKKEFQGDITSLVLGSTGLTASADTVMLWERDLLSSQGILRIVGRDIDDNVWTLDLNSVTGKWTILSEGDSRDMSPQQMTILSILANTNTPLGPQDIAGRGGLSCGSTRVLLRKMADAGRLTCTNHKYSIVKNNC